MSHTSTKKLVYRLYAISFVQILLVIGSVITVGYFVGPPRRPHHPPAPMETRPPLPPPHASHGVHTPWEPILTALGFGAVIVLVGATFTARWIVRPLENLSDVAQKLGTGDLSARARMARDDEFGDLGRAFDDMAERLQTLVLAEKELLANVSHELRTPLARIRVALDLAREGDAAAAREALGEIGVDLAELEGLIDDILTATRMELAERKAASFGFDLHREELAPAVLAERAAERFRARHAKRTLEVRVDQNLPLAFVDPVLFRRVLDNLLENAHKYTPDADRAVVLHASRGADESAVAFSVEDRGQGIGAEDLPQIFAPFFRADKSRSRGTGGVGLGLTLVKRIVEAHGGRVNVKSTMGVGTTVRVEIPFTPRAPTHS